MPDCTMDEEYLLHCPKLNIDQQVLKTTIKLYWDARAMITFPPSAIGTTTTAVLNLLSHVHPGIVTEENQAISKKTKTSPCPQKLLTPGNSKQGQFSNWVTIWKWCSFCTHTSNHMTLNTRAICHISV